MFIAEVLVRLLTNKNLGFLLVDKRTRTDFYIQKRLSMLVNKLTSTHGMLANWYTDLNLIIVYFRGYLHTNTVPGYSCHL